MEIEPGMTAVDLGAGTGYFLGHLSRAAAPSTACSSSTPGEFLWHLTEHGPVSPNQDEK
jgi:predicted methyltransferase